MANILLVKKKGKTLKEYTLEAGRECVIGRASSCQIVLNESHGVSRKHIQVVLSEDSLTCQVECLSKLGGVIFNGEETPKFELKKDGNFYFMDYHFQHQLQSTEKKESLEIEEEGNALKSTPLEAKKNNSREEISSLLNTASSMPEAPSPPQQEQGSLSLEKKTAGGGTESGLTRVTQISKDLTPYLVISLSSEDEDQEVLLEGKKWIIGRDPACDICIEDKDISRKHFEIEKINDEFSIKDLASSNCTHLDEELLEPHQSYPLKSGALIQILDIQIFFEIRNKRVKKKLSSLDQPPALTPSADELVQGVIAPPAESGPPSLPAAYSVIADETILTSPPPSGSSSRKKKLIFIGVAFILIGTALFFMPQKDTSSKKESSNTLSLNEPLNSLDPENQAKVKDIYALAQQLYHQKKYELCSEKLKSLHEIIPYYEQSKSLFSTCKNGAESIQAQIEIDRRNREEQQTKANLEKNIKECAKKFKTFTSMAELKACLAPALEIDPEHFEITDLMSRFSTEEEAKKSRAAAQAAYKAKLRKEKKAYEAVKKIKESGKILKAIPAYQKFLKRKHPKGVEEIVSQAGEELKAMQDSLQAQISALMSQCQNLMDQKQFKEAHPACVKVLSVSPGNKQAIELADNAIKAIHKELKPIYEDSVLNESLGNIDIAKKHWASILEKDIQNGYYALKAQKKLNKY